MKILLTGASGFFGRNFLDGLAAASGDFECFCVYQNHRFPPPDARFKWVHGDLLDQASVGEIVRTIRPTHCVHLAWYVPPQEFWTSSRNIDWIFASIKLFQAFAESGGRVFIGAGSLAEYHWGDKSLDETATPLHPATLYGQSKLSLCELLLSLRNTCFPDVRLVWPRIGYFFGPYESSKKLIPRLIASIKSREPMKLAGAETSRPYAHVRHFSDVLMRILFQDYPRDLIFNLSATDLHSLEEIVETIVGCVGKDAGGMKFGAYVPPSTEPVVLSVNAEVLKRELNYAIPATFSSDLRAHIVSQLT